ncbi:hypothetical protein AVEN_46003-1 [Araneus ventricosus]|uniref:Uncharacterized protein n=1 Tax=Araneus ventricosus TaxID=182803 RepID=A0A4Y2F8F2_ARAVE|nr:hypothetical protein AVEN_46003-1 [Araneus ventricosus]
MSKGAKQVPVTPRHSERIHPVHRHLRSAEGPGSPRGVPNSGQRCLRLKACTPDFLFLGFDSAPATAPSQVPRDGIKTKKTQTGPRANKIKKKTNHERKEQGPKKQATAKSRHFRVTTAKIRPRATKDPLESCVPRGVAKYGGPTMGPKEKTKNSKKGSNQKVGTHCPKHRLNMYKVRQWKPRPFSTIKQSV